MKRYILWDNDGVLVDTEFWYFKATQQALAELGVELSLQAYQQRMVRGASSWDLAREAGVDPDHIAKQQQQRDADYQQFLARKNIDIAGVEPVLHTLSKSYRMGVVTTSTRANFELIHNTRTLMRHMDFVLTREDYVASKPDPEPYLLALHKLGATADECLVVEDSQRGLLSALAAGIDCVVVYNHFTASHDFTGASHMLDSIVDLPGIIDVRAV